MHASRGLEGIGGSNRKREPAPPVIFSIASVQRIKKEFRNPENRLTEVACDSG